MTWRQKARPIIAAVLAMTKGQDERSIRRALREAYPFDEREMYPYKAWLLEVRAQRRLVPPSVRHGRRHSCLPGQQHFHLEEAIHDP